MPLSLQRLERSKAVERLELLERLVLIAAGTRSTATIPITAGCAMHLSMLPKQAKDRGDELKCLKTLDPSLTVIKSVVIGIRDDKALEATVYELSPFVDGFITDTFDPKTGASGATGKTHDWRVSRGVVELSDRPVILAGGLTPENVKRAILEVRPAGVNSHIGVEDSSGRKCREKARRFLSEAYEAFRSLKQSSDHQQRRGSGWDNQKRVVSLSQCLEKSSRMSVPPQRVV